MLGILGGTFDPIHFGHLRTAVEVAEHFGITDMHLIPGKVPPHRPQPLATPEQRFEMLQRALVNEPNLHADPRELKRTGLSYSVLTLESFRAEVGAETPLFFCMGFDAFAKFQTWHRWQDILALTHLVIVQRAGYSVPPAGWHAPYLTQDKQQLCTVPAGKIYGLAITPLDVSATQIRECLHAGRNPRYLLPDTVIDYIYTHQLYCET